MQRWRLLGWSVFGILLLAGVWMLVARLLQSGPAPQRRAETTITQVMLPPPPPPPPPPPKEEPQKPPEVQPKEQTPQQPKPQARASSAKPSPAPPGNPLTAEAGPGSNQYGLAVGNGSGDTGGGGGGGGDPFGYYDGVVASRVRQILASNEDTRYGNYNLVVAVWVSDAGIIQRAQLVRSTGDAARDAAIEKALIGQSAGEAKPSGWPQPRRMQISASAG